MFKKTTRTISSFMTLAYASVFLVTGCQTTSQNTQSASPAPALAETVDSLLDKLRADYRTGGPDVDYRQAERAYKQDSQNPQNAALYAKALRQNGLTKRAEIILTPFLKNDPDAALLSEYSAILLEEGRFARAEQYANMAMDKDPRYHMAYQTLGIALDAQGYHDRAEAAFRDGLSIWQGDPVPILNNLALSLSSQGYIEDAQDILRRASEAAPQRSEIERNLRIISALQKNVQDGRSGEELEPITN